MSTTRIAQRMYRLAYIIDPPGPRDAAAAEVALQLLASAIEAAADDPDSQATTDAIAALDAHMVTWRAMGAE